MPEQPSIRPFKALRYNLDISGNLAELIAPPYDVIGPEQQKALYAKSPYNIAWLDVTQEGSGEPSAARYAKAADDFTTWQGKGILQRETEECIYVYEQEFTSPTGQRITRRGFYGLRRLEAFGTGRVYPHERTLSGPKKDRLALMKATSAQMSPIFGLFRDESGQAALLLQEAVQADPLFNITDDSGQEHRLWAVTDAEWIQKLQAAVATSPYLIADGHHRYETALAFRQWRKETNPDYQADDNSNYVLMFCEDMDDPGLLVLPTHRFVQNRPLFSAELFLTHLRKFFSVREIRASEDKKWMGTVQAQGKEGHAFGIAFRGDPVRYVATIANKDLAKIPALKSVPEPLRSLDATIVHKCFLENFLDYTEMDQENPQFISYIKSEQEMLAKIDQAPAQVGIIMNAAPLSQIHAIAKAGQFMPPKTTYFYPKLPTGLVINLID